MYHQVIIVALTAIVLFQKFTSASQPSYQVSIWLNTSSSIEPRINDIHICNGIIIHEALILTTATCVHFLDHFTGQFREIPSARLYITAGSSSIDNDLVYRSVKSVQIEDGFNMNTLDNDIAMLLLNASLQLENRSDIKWIILDDNEHLQYTCVVNFPSHNSKGSIAQQSSLMNNERCRNATTFKNSRTYDICSTYSSQSGSSCDTTNNFLNNNVDRGSGYICNGRNVGLLSSIIAPKNKTVDCSQSSEYLAFYTLVGYHMNWIYGYMSTKEVRDMENPNLTSSVPYQSPNLDPPLLITVPLNDSTVNAENSPSYATENNITANNLTVTYPDEITVNNVTVNNATVNNATVNNATVNNATVNNSINGTLISIEKKGTNLPKDNIIVNSTTEETHQISNNASVTTNIPTRSPTQTTEFNLGPRPTPSDKLIVGSSSGHISLSKQYFFVILLVLGIFQ